MLFKFFNYPHNLHWPFSFFPVITFDLQGSNQELLASSQRLYKVLHFCFDTHNFLNKFWLVRTKSAQSHELSEFYASWASKRDKHQDTCYSCDEFICGWKHTQLNFSIMRVWHNLWLSKLYANFGKFVKSCFGEYKQVRFSVEFCSMIKVLGIRFED